MVKPIARLPLTWVSPRSAFFMYLRVYTRLNQPAGTPRLKLPIRSNLVARKPRHSKGQRPKRLMQPLSAMTVRWMTFGMGWGYNSQKGNFLMAEAPQFKNRILSFG